MTLRDRVAKAAETYLHQRADFAAPINFADLADAVIEAGLSERDGSKCEECGRTTARRLTSCERCGLYLAPPDPKDQQA